MKPTLHIVTGTTAVGKTEWTLRLAERLNAEIVSCDASCVYQGMDIGTAKPSAEEQARVPHHLIDVVPASEPYDVVRYAAAARACVDAIVARGRPVIVAGGSGFYLKSFFAPIADEITVPDAVRSHVRALDAAEGASGLRAALQKLNPDGWGNLDAQNPRRLARALERCLASGKTLLEIQSDFAALPSPFADFQKTLTVLVRGKDDLNTRIEQRVAAMIAAELIEEVRQLRAAGLEQNPVAAGAIGYREVLAHLRGELTHDALPAEIAANTRKLAAKQRKWIRNQLPPADEQILFPPESGT